jgi:hypothetical protein
MYILTTNNYATSHTLTLFLDIRNTGHIRNFYLLIESILELLIKIVFIQHTLVHTFLRIKPTYH